MTDSKLSLAASQMMAAAQVVLNGVMQPTALNAPFSHNASHDRIYYSILLIALKGTFDGPQFTCAATVFYVVATGSLASQEWPYACC